MSIPLAASPRPTTRARSAGAVAAAIVVGAALSLGTDQVLHATGVYPPWGEPMSDALFTLATAYRVVFTILGGWIVARLAPGRPMRHALVLGLIGVAVSLAGTVATWNRGPEFGPKWYPLVLIVLTLPSTLLGARVARR